MRALLCALGVIVLYYFLPDALAISGWLGLFCFCGILFGIGAFAYYIPRMSEIENKNNNSSASR